MKNYLPHFRCAVVAALLIAAMACPRRGVAATVLVYNNNDNGAGSLRQAINDNNAAGGGNTIIISNVVTGTITLVNGQLVISKDLILIGPGPNQLAVSGNNTYRVFYVTNAATVSISGLTIRNGSAPNSTFPTNSGGGIYNDHSTLTISNCNLSGNSAPGAGGGIFNSGVAPSGSRPPTTLTLITSTLSGNSAGSEGGGICNEADHTSPGATVALLRCTVSGNSAGTSGGGIDNFGNAGSVALTINNCTFSGNSAISSGGGIYNFNFPVAGTTAPLKVIACTFGGNSSPSGGGIYNRGFGIGAMLELGNTILKAGASGVNITNSGGAVTSDGFNLSSDNGGGFLTAVGDQVNADPKLGPLQDNGGPTLTIAPLPGSPAIDQGKSFGLTTDQRGRPRPYDNPAVPNNAFGDGSDIGAVEISPSTLVVLNDNDSGAGSLRQAILDASSGDSDVISFAAGLNGTVTLISGELLVGKSLSIAGPGAKVLGVSGNNASRVFNVTNGFVNISGLTIRDGTVVGAPGRPGQTVFGGGVFCDSPATLTLTECIISNCAAIGGNGTSVFGSGNGGNAGHGYGGGIFNQGELALDQCWVVGNQAAGGGGGHGGVTSSSTGGNGGSGLGGGIYNSFGSLIMRDCTLGGNRATFGSGGFGSRTRGNNGTAEVAGLNNNGGPAALINSTVASNVVDGAGTGFGGGVVGGVALLSCTVVGNNGDSSGGGIQGGASVTNTIIAGNIAVSSPDVNGPITSGGYNLIGNTSGSSGFGSTGDQLNIDPLLGPLQDNGGPTPTMALLPGSPAIDKGKSFGLTADQRGSARPFDLPSIANASGGDGSDIGAFEAGRPFLNITLAAPNVVIAWPTYFGGFTLEYVTHLLASNNWSTVPGTPAIVGGQFNVTNNAANGNKFFRLRGP